MKKTVIAFGLILGTIFLTSCSMDISGMEEVKGNGNRVEKSLEPGEFSGIRLKGNFEVKLHPGESHAVKIVGDENLQELITTEIKDDILWISSDKTLASKEGIDVDIYADEISSISLGGATDLESEATLKSESLKLVVSGAGDVDLDLEVDEFDVNISGAGDLELSGSANRADFGISGAANLEGFDLKTHTLSLNMSGAANAEVYVDEDFKIRLSGLGNVKYKGNPTNIDKKVSGLGAVSEG